MTLVARRGPGVASVLLSVALTGCGPVPMPDPAGDADVVSGLRVGDRIEEHGLRDRRGGPISLVDDDRVSVLAFVGGESGEPDALPRILERVLELPRRLPRTPLQRIVAPLVPSSALATAIPETLEVAGPPEAIRDLAGSLGVAVAPEPEGWLAGHAVVVVDRNGRITTILRGIVGWDAAVLAREVAAAARR